MGRQVKCAHAVADGNVGIVGAVGGAVVFAAHEGQPCLFAQAGAGAGELHVAAHRVRRAVDDQQQRLVLCFLAKGVPTVRDLTISSSASSSASSPKASRPSAI